MNSLSYNEERVLSVISSNPYISQADIGRQLDMNRSTVATTISSLSRKGMIKGRAYVINQLSKVFCVGGMNVDRHYVLHGPLMEFTSNPVTSSISVGGVGRNITENLGRLGIDIAMLSVAGMDQDYQYIKQQTEPYVNLDHMTLLNQWPTSTYSAVINQAGDMEVAFADMSIADQMNLDWIIEHKSILMEAEYIIADLNVQREVIEELRALSLQNDIKLIIVPVSGPKMIHLPEDLTGVTWLIVNRDESEAYFQLEANTVSSEELAQRWIDTGVEHVVITGGIKPTIYLDQSGTQHQIQPPLNPKVVDVTGAGDSNAAGIIYGYIKGQTALDCLHYGMANAYHTVATKQTVRPNLTEQLLLSETQELFYREELN